MSKVTVFGSFVVDLMARSPHLPVAGETVKGSMFRMGPGGKGFNQCVAAHKAGADVVMITKLGKDVFADVALNTMSQLVVYDFKVPPMITTLGTSTIIRGIVLIISNALTVSGLDPRVLAMGNNSMGGFLPVLAIIWLVVAVIVFLILRYRVFGRNLYVIGSGMEVARLSGIKVRKMIYFVYAFAGLLYGIAGIMLAARVQSALPTGGDGYDMNAIAAAVIGGASLAGGRGAISGTLLGTILMVLINNAGVQFGLNTHVLEITSGVLIIFAVTMDMLKNRKKA